MRKVLSFCLALWLSVSPFLNGLLASALAAPTVGAPLVSPSAVPAGVATQVTVTSQIISGPGDPPVLPTGVNLLQVDAQDRVLAILGTMRDDGTGGDAVAGNGVFTLRITVNQAAAGDIRLRVSAAFRGRAQRVISPLTILPVQIAQNQPPVFTSTPPTLGAVGVLYSYQATGRDPEGGALSFQLISGPSGMIVGQSTGLVQWTPTLGQVGNQGVEIKVFDPQGAGVSQTFTIGIPQPNQPPIITSSPNTTATEASPYQYQVAAQDPEGGQLSFQLMSGPTGMTIGQTSGLVQWTPTKAQVGDQNVQLQAIDPQGAPAVQSFTIHVAALNLPPVISSVPTTTASTTLLYLYQVTAQDPEGGALTYQLVTGPTGMTIAPATGLVLWTPTAAQIGNQNVQLKVVDPLGAETPQNFTLAVSELNLAPVITSVPITFAKTTEPYIYNVTAFDPEKKTVQFSFSEPQPSGMTIDAASGAVRWSPTNSQIGNVRVAVRATDPGGAFDTQAFNLKVFDPSNDLQIISPTGAPSIRIGQTLTLPLQANYTGAGFSVNPALTNGSIAGSNFTFNPTSDQEGVQTITFKATYGDMQKSVVIPITVTRNNSSPVIAPPGQQSVQEGASLTFTISASDAENDPLTYAAPGLNLANAFFNTFSHQFTFNPVVGQAGNYQVVFSVSDGRTTSQITVPIQVTKTTGQQQVLDLVVDPLSNPTLQGSATISGNVTGQPGTPQPKQTPPLVTGLIPSGAKQGQTLTVQITGLNTNFGQTTSRADFGSGITVNSLTVASTTNAQANITIDKLASLGIRTVRMIGAGTEAQSVIAFNVEKGVASITGTVIDPFTNLPLVNATVTINGTTISALTDSQGRFTLTDVPTGAVPLIITLPNYDVQQFTIGVGASDTIALQDPIKMNALARPPRLAGTLPRAATVVSVLDRGIAEPSSNMTLEDAKAAISDSMITVGGNAAGVVDENGNQLNPKLHGVGMFSLTQQGVENQARMLQMGQTYRLQDILFQLRGAYSFALDIANDSEILAGLQSVVNEAWANPDDPASAMAFIVFNSGTLRSATPPKLSFETRVNSFQAMLIHASFLSYYASDIDQAINRIAAAKGVPPPEISLLSPMTGRSNTVAARAARGLASFLASLPKLLGPSDVQAAEISVAERRLQERTSWTAFWTKQRFISAIPDAVIAGIAAFALAYAVGSIMNYMIGTTGAPGATAALFLQALNGAAIGAGLAVFQKLLLSWGLENVVQWLHPDAPIGGTISISPTDGSADIVFSQSSAESQTTATLPDGTVVHKLPDVGDWKTALIRPTDVINGVDTSKLRFAYFIFQFAGPDDQNIIDKPPLPIRSSPVFVNNQLVPGLLKFHIPAKYLRNEVNYFRIATYQIYDSKAVLPDFDVTPYHFSDFNVDVSSQFPSWLGYLLSFGLGFSPPGFDLNLVNPTRGLFGFNPDFGGPNPNYLDPLFRDARKAIAVSDIASRENGVKAGVSDYLKQFGLAPDTDVFTLRAQIAEHQGQLSQLLESRTSLLTSDFRFRLSNVATAIESVANDPTASLDQSNLLTEKIATLLERPGQGLNADQVRIFSNFRDAAVFAKDAGDVLGLQTGFMNNLKAFGKNIQKVQSGTQGLVDPAALDDFAVKGRPNFSFSATQPTFANPPSFSDDVTIRVNQPFGAQTNLNDVPLTIEQPGHPTQSTTFGELLQAEGNRQVKLQGIVDLRNEITAGEFSEVRRLFEPDAELGQRLQDVKANEIDIAKTQQRIGELENQVGGLQESVESVAKGHQISLKTVAAFEKLVGRVTNGVAVAGILFTAVDTRASIATSAAQMTSQLSEALVVFKARDVSTSTARIASDPSNPNGILFAKHLSEQEARLVPGNETRQYPIVDGQIGLKLFGDQGESTQPDAIPSEGFPTDYFAVDSNGVIYANNLNSNASFGGRIFRFTRSTPAGGSGTQRDFAGSINYYSLDAFLPPRPAEPIAMGIGDYCCSGSVVESPFVADIDFDANPPAGRIRRIPVEQIGAPGARIVGQTWATSQDLKLETPAAFVSGIIDQLPASAQLHSRPMFLSDGPRIWLINQDFIGVDFGSLKKLVDSPERQWGGLMVDSKGTLFALDTKSGDVWALPLAAVQSAVQSALAGTPLTTQDFDELAFKVASDQQHVGALDLANTTDYRGFFVSDPNAKITLEDAAIVGVVPDEVTSFDLFIPSRSAKIPVTLYSSGGKKRFLAQVPVADAIFDTVRFIVAGNGVIQNGSFKLNIDAQKPLFGVYFVPEDKLTGIIRGQ
jgi:hypothetical protein